MIYLLAYLTILRRIRFLGGFALVIFVPQFALASITITEIMYDAPGADTGREWIEIYNDGAYAVNLANWRLLEGGVRHKLIPSRDDSIPPQSYALIVSDPVAFAGDYPQYAGSLYDSSFSLSSAGETIALLDASSTAVASATYSGSQGAAGDGNSLNRANGQSSFVPRAPTPGAAMSAATIPPPPQKTALPKSANTKTKAPRATAAVGEVFDDETAADPPASSAAATSAEEAASSQAVSSSIMPWLSGVGVLALFAGAAVFLARTKKKEEWDIVEQSGD